MKYSSAGQVDNKFEAEKLAGDVLKDVKEDLQDSVLANAGDGIFGKLLNSIVTKIIDASAVAANNTLVNELVNGATADDLARQAAVEELQNQVMQNALEIPEGEFGEMPEELEEKIPEDLETIKPDTKTMGGAAKKAGMPATSTSGKESPAKDIGTSKPGESGTPTPEKSVTGSSTTPVGNDNADTTEDQGDEDAGQTQGQKLVPPSSGLPKKTNGDQGNTIQTAADQVAKDRGSEQSSAHPKDVSIRKSIPKMGRVINLADYKKRKALGSKPEDKDKQPTDQTTQSEPDDQQTTPQPSAPDETPTNPTDTETSAPEGGEQPGAPEGAQPEAQPDQNGQDNDVQPQLGQEGQGGEPGEGEQAPADQGEKNKQKNRLTQMANKIRFRNEIKPLDNQLKLYNRSVLEIQRKINPTKNKIKPLTVAKRVLQTTKWSLRILQILLYVIAAILAASIIFLFLIPIAPMVYFGAQALEGPIEALNVQIDILNKKIKDLEKEIKDEEEKRNKIMKIIMQLYAQRRAIINRNLRQQKQEQEEGDAQEEIQQAV